MHAETNALRNFTISARLLAVVSSNLPVGGLTASQESAPDSLALLGTHQLALTTHGHVSRAERLGVQEAQ